MKTQILSQGIKNSLYIGLAGLTISCTVPEPSNSTQATLPDPTVELTADQVLVLGDISSNPTEAIEEYQRLADYLGSRLSDVGIEQAKVKIAPDLETMQTWIANGDVDLYFDSPYPVMIVSNKTGAKPLLRRWKQGISEYYGLIFALKDSKIETAADLGGQTIALESDFSTSGYMLPLAALKDADLQPVDMSSGTKGLQENEVGFIFSEDEGNTFELVISGEVSAGAFDNGTFAELPDEVQSRMTAIVETETVARHIVLAAPDLSVEQADAIKTLLLAMDESAEGQVVLESLARTTQFDEFPVEQSLEQLQEIYNQTL